MIHKTDVLLDKARAENRNLVNLIQTMLDYLNDQGLQDAEMVYGKLLAGILLKESKEQEVESANRI